MITKENKTIKWAQKTQTFAHTYPDFIRSNKCSMILYQKKREIEENFGNIVY
jgi:hypothetical protein